MALITLRSSLTRPLTNAEIDGNFTNLNAGQTNSVAITGGSINGVAIGGSTAGAGSFTTLAASDLVTLSNKLRLSDGSSLLPALYFQGNTTSGFYSSTSNVIGVAISASSIGTFTSTGLNGMDIGTTTRGAGAFTTLAANGNVTLGDADTDTITVGASFVNGTVLRSAKTATNTLALAAYDVDGTAYTNLITLTASNTPTVTITSTGVGKIDNIDIGSTTRAAGNFTSLAANAAVTFSATTQNIAATSQTTGTITIGGTAGTGALTFGSSTDTQTTNIANGVTASAKTNTISIGNNGASGSITTITIGSTTGTTSTLRGTVALSSATAGGLLKAAATSGNVSVATAGTDYLAPPSGTALLKANSGGALANATAGTDYLAPPSGTALLKANSGGALANATAGTDYIAPYGSTTANTFLGAPDGSAGTPSFRALANGDIPKTLTGFSTVTINASATTSTGFGYATGAGSTGTQGTSLTTTVVMGKACMTGEITLFSGARAANTTYTFSVTNAAFQVGDHIVVTHASAGSLGAYTFAANCTVAGTGTFSIRTAAALTEAPVIKFTILRSVTA